MPRVLIQCPLTEQMVPTGLTTTGEKRFRRSLPTSAVIGCPACRRSHAWSREEAVIEGRERRLRTGIAAV